MNLQEFKSELRMNNYDPWGNSMDAFFELCAHLHYEDANIPAEWEYSPSSVVNDCREDENYFYCLFEACTVEQLLIIGAFLYRYTGMLRFKGVDY